MTDQPIGSYTVGPMASFRREVWAGLALWLVALAILVHGLRPSAMVDYREAIYPAGRAVLAGAEPYAPWMSAVADAEAHPGRLADPFLLSLYQYPPTGAILAAPFSALDVGRASWAWFFLNILAVTIAAVLTAWALRPRRLLLCSGVVGLSFASFDPVREVLAVGNLDVLMMAMGAAGLAATLRVQRQHPGLGLALGGGFLGLAVGVKIYYLALVGFFVLRRRAGLVAVSVLALVLAVALSLLFEPAWPRNYLRVLGVGTRPELMGHVYSFGVLAFLSRAAGLTPYAPRSLDLSSATVQLLIVSWSLTVVAVTGLVVWRFGGRNPAGALVAVVAAALLGFPALSGTHLNMLALVLPFFGAGLVLRLRDRRPGASAPMLKLPLEVMVLGLPLAALVLGQAVDVAGIPHAARWALPAILLVGSGSYWLLAKNGWSRAEALLVGGLAGSLTFLGSPAFAAMTAWHSDHLSRTWTFLGEAQLYALFTVLVLSLLLLRFRWPAPENL